jgi:hypothetical protein
MSHYYNGQVRHTTTVVLPDGTENSKPLSIGLGGQSCINTKVNGEDEFSCTCNYNTHLQHDIELFEHTPYYIDDH